MKGQSLVATPYCSLQVSISKAGMIRPSQPILPLILKASASYSLFSLESSCYLFLTTLIVKMPSQLCHVCPRIPPEFFSKKFDDIWSFQGPAICLQPVNSIHRAASSGCSLCAVLIARSKTDFLPPDVLERVPVSLRRAVLDTHQAIGLWIGIDDISHTSFFRVPPSWSKQKAPSVWLQDRIRVI